MNLGISINNKFFFIKALNRKRYDIDEIYGSSSHLGNYNGFKHYLNISKYCQNGSNFIEVTVNYSDGTRFFLKSFKFEAITSKNLNSFEDKFKCLPADHLLKVNGSVDIQSYIDIGKQISDVICDELKNYNKRQSILDYGCGLGRVLFHLNKRFNKSKIYAYDIDNEILKWANFILSNKFVRFESSTDIFESGKFDIVYCISVFTHIYNNRDKVILDIKRILKKRGILFVSFHDKTLFNEIYKNKKNRFYANELVVGNCFNDGDEGKGVFYDSTYWYDYLGKHFTHVKTEIRKLCGFQSYSIFINDR